MTWFWPVLAQIWSPKFFFVDFISIWCYTFLQAIIVCNSRKTNKPNLTKCQKNIVSGLVLAQLTQIRAAKFFKKSGWLSLDIIVSYHLVQYRKKIMIKSWENVVGARRTDGQTDKRTHRREWFHRTLSDWRQASKGVLNLCQILSLWNMCNSF